MRLNSPAGQLVCYSIPLASIGGGRGFAKTPRQLLAVARQELTIDVEQAGKGDDNEDGRHAPATFATGGSIRPSLQTSFDRSSVMPPQCTGSE